MPLPLRPSSLDGKRGQTPGWATAAGVLPEAEEGPRSSPRFSQAPRGSFAARRHPARLPS